MKVIIDYNYDRDEFYISASEGATHQEIVDFLEQFLRAVKENGIEPHLKLVGGGEE